MILKSVNIDLKVFWAAGILFILAMFAAVVFDLTYLMLLPVAVSIVFIFFQDIRLAFFAMIFTLPLSFQYMEKYDFPDEPLMILNTGFFLFFCLFNYQKIKLKSLLLNPVVIAVLLTFVWLIISVIMSKDVLLSSKFLLKKTWYLIPFFIFPIILFQKKKSLYVRISYCLDAYF